MALYGGVELPGRPDLENVRRLDLLGIRPVQRCQRIGFAIDPPYFHDLSISIGKRAAEKKRIILSMIPPDKLKAFIEASGTFDDEVDEDEFNVDSTQQMATMLFEILGIGKGTKLKTTKKGAIAADKEQLENLKSSHPIVQEVLDYRGLVKIKGTYVDKLPRIARFHPAGTDCPECGLAHYYPTWRVHTQILGTRTATGRYASKNPNLQNLGARTADGRAVRAGFIASPGTRLIANDFSQIELRMLAHISGDETMIQVYLDDGDIHTKTACGAFGIEPHEVNKLVHRPPAKIANFSIAYGTTEIGFLAQLKMAFLRDMKIPVPAFVTEAWVKQFIDKWFLTYPRVKPFMDKQTRDAMKYGIVWTLAGRVRRIPEVRSVHKRIQQAGIRQAGNVKDQGTCADLMRLAMAAVDDRCEQIRQAGYWVWPLLTVHDELILEAEEDVAEAVQGMMQEEMDHVAWDRQTGKNLLKVPIKSDGGILERWEK